MLVHRLVRLRKHHLGGDVTDWHQAERLAEVGPEVVVVRVANRVGGVVRWLGRGSEVPADLASCQGVKVGDKITPSKIKIKNSRKEDVLPSCGQGVEVQFTHSVSTCRKPG